MLSRRSDAGGETPRRPWPADQSERWPIEHLIPYAHNARLHSEADLDKIAATEVDPGRGRARLERGGEACLPPGRQSTGGAGELGPRAAPQRAPGARIRRFRPRPDRLRAGSARNHPGRFGIERSDRSRQHSGSPRSTGLSVRRPMAVGKPPPGWLRRQHQRGRCGASAVADPPYGVGYEPSWRARRNLSTGKLAQGKVLNDDRADWREAYALFPGDVAYVWHGALHGDVVAADLAACGLQLRAQIIWAKQHFTLSRGDYHWKHETCWYAVREGKASHWQGDRTQTTVWEIPNNNPFGNRQREQSWGHGTQKPVECMRRPITNNSRPGQAIYDPFLGSGTSLIAAEMTGRVCYGIELNPAYADVVVRRWQDFTGRTARHQASGQLFDERAGT